MRKLRILIFCRYYRPAFKAGGPVVSINNLTEHLGDVFEFYIVTGDRDINDKKPFKNITYRNWHRVGNALVQYLPPGKRRLASIFRIMKNMPFDLIYLNSFMDPIFTTFPLLLCRFSSSPHSSIILAPRGEFSSGALSIKTLKKNLFIRFSKLTGFHERVVWHASNIHEERHLLATLGSSKIVHIAENVPPQVPKNQPRHVPRKKGAPIRICFLSRISEMKNLVFVINVLSKVRESADLVVFGPIEDRPYWGKCEELASKLPANTRFTYCGSVDPEKVCATIAKADLFFLPTQGENFGHAIFEALSSGTPILISDQTPWNDLEDKGIGWAFSLNSIDRYVEVIEMMAVESEKSAMVRRQVCYAFAANLIKNNIAIADNKRMFEKVSNA